MSVRIIVAVDRDLGFGKDGKIPWHYPEDFKHFKNTTSGHICVMGRKTYEDMADMMVKAGRKIKANILPNRTCYVVSSNVDAEFNGATRVSGIREVLELHPEEAHPENQNNHIWICGGEKMYIQSMAWVSHIHLTAVDAVFGCDRFFPNTALNGFTIQSGTKITTKKDDTTLYMMTYERNGYRR